MAERRIINISSHDDRHSMRGFSLVEMTIVLAVLAIVLGGVWGAVRVGWETYYRQQAVDEITTVAQNVRDAYAGQPGLPRSGLQILTSSMITKAIIPKNMVRTTNCINPGGQCADAPWGKYDTGVVSTSGTFRVCDWNLATAPVDCAAAGPGGLVQSFGIVLRGLTVGGCMEVVGRISGPSGPPGLLEVNIDGTNIGPTGSGDPIRPVSGSDLTKFCAAKDGANTIRFVYSLIAPPP